MKEGNEVTIKDTQLNEEHQLGMVKSPSDLLAGVPSRWKEDEALSNHLDLIVSSYHKYASSSDQESPRGRRINWSSAKMRKDNDNDTNSSSSPCSTHQNSNGIDSDQESLSNKDDMNWSIGASKHEAGQCKPCGWHHKPGGCSKGKPCEFCHLCGVHALKSKKKARIQRCKLVRRALKTEQEVEELHSPRPFD